MAEAVTHVGSPSKSQPEGPSLGLSMWLPRGHRWSPQHKQNSVMQESRGLSEDGGEAATSTGGALKRSRTAGSEDVSMVGPVHADKAHTNAGIPAGCSEDASASSTEEGAECSSHPAVDRHLADGPKGDSKIQSCKCAEQLAPTLLCSSCKSCNQMAHLVSMDERRSSTPEHSEREGNYGAVGRLYMRHDIVDEAYLLPCNRTTAKVSPGSKRKLFSATEDAADVSYSLEPCHLADTSMPRSLCTQLIGQDVCHSLPALKERCTPMPIVMDMQRGWPSSPRDLAGLQANYPADAFLSPQKLEPVWTKSALVCPGAPRKQIKTSSRLHLRNVYRVALTLFLD